MLQQGFHESFREICAILSWQKEDREKLGAEHPLHRRPLLEDEPEKFKYLCQMLTKIENSKRKGQKEKISEKFVRHCFSSGRYAVVYKFYLELAMFFFKSEDHWLSDLLYEKCLIVAQTQSQLDPQFSAEAFLNVGLAYERRGELFRALENFKEYRRLSENHSRLRTDANLQLTRLFLKIADRKSNEEKLIFVLNAYESAQQSQDEQTEFETAFQLGQVYLQHDQIDRALQLFHEFYDYCRRVNDYDGFGQVSQSLAICYQKLLRNFHFEEYLQSTLFHFRKGNLKKSMSFLNRYLDRVFDHQNDLQFVRVASTLGLIQITQVSRIRKCLCFDRSTIRLESIRFSVNITQSSL